ncbi:MAG: TRAP transporter substrate-binding protein [Lachnospiraceae bacterium]|nr:TRAP transporter substrate-binding protein [Lachnospiraceae bacterium]
MKKYISVLLTIGLAVVMLSGCGSKNEAVQAENVVLKIGVSTGDQDPRNIAAQEFAKEISEKTNGAISAMVYPSGQLGGDAALIDAMAIDSKKVDIIITDASNFATYEPKMGISAMPFLFDDFDTAWAFMDSNVEAKAEELLVKNNMRVLAHYCNGFRCVTNSKHPIETPEDMKGLVIRTPENPMIMATMTALGANPQPLSFAELYPALRQGTYDAQENPIPVIYNNKLYEVQKYLSITNHIYSGMCFTISESMWQKFSEEQKKIIQEAALNSAQSDRTLNREQTESLTDDLEKAGMIVNSPDLGPFAAATASVLESNKSTYGELYDELEKWKADR